MSLKKILGTTLPLVLLGAFALRAAKPSQQIPLPDDLSLPATTAGVPAETAGFGGAWGGDAWGGRLPHVLVIERFNTDGTVGLVYAVGDRSDGKIKGTWIRHVGTISGGRLHCILPSGAVVDYAMNGDGTLLGRYFSAGVPAYVRLTRIAGADTKDIMAAAAKLPAPFWTEVRIPEHSTIGETAGKTVTLQAMLYRTTPNGGRRPLVIYNHGSTGGGIVPASSMHLWLDGAIPRVFLSLGYDVVEPLRKGFGRSEGPMIEEAANNPQEVQLDSALEDLDAVIEHMKTQPSVDPSHIILVGQSRGGMLAVAYAGRHPDKIAGVINFSGGWWGEYVPSAEFNFVQFSEAGRTTKVPMLWLYADHDSLYSLGYIERAFKGFRASGGNGELVEVRDLAGDGHFLSAWPEKWQEPVAAFLKKIP